MESEVAWLLGDVDTTNLIVENPLALLYLFDTTMTAALCFAAVCLLSISFCHHQYLTRPVWFLVNLVLSGIDNFIITPVDVTVDVITTACSELSRVRSLWELDLALQNIKTRLQMNLVQTTPYRVLYRLHGFLLPPSQTPTILRLLGYLLACASAYPVVLYLAHYILGLSEGLWSDRGEVSAYCLEVYFKYDVLGPWTHRQQMETVFCWGEEAGLELQARLQDDLTSLPSSDGEIAHLGACVLAFVCLPCLVLVSLAFLEPDSQPTIAVSTASGPRLEEERAAERENALRSDNSKLRVDLAWMKRELKATYDRLYEALENCDGLRALVNTTEWSRAASDIANEEVRRELFRLEGELQVVHDQAAQTWSNEVANLNQKLANSKEAAANAASEIDSLKRALQAEAEKLTAAETRLQETKDQAAKACSNIKALADAQFAECAAKYNDLKALCDKMVDNLRALESVKQERDDAAARVISLQGELEQTKRIANDAYAEWVRAMQEAQENERALSQRLQAVESAFNEQCRANQQQAYATAMSQAEASQTEREELRSRLEKALSDAQTGKEEAQKLKTEVENLQLDLARHGVSHGGSSQNIPERKAANPSASQVRGSIKTALEDRDMKIQALEHEVEELRKPREGMTDERLKAWADKLGKDLKEEKAARVNDQLRWHKQLQELQEENRKLTISLSNAETALGRRSSK